MVDAMNNSKSEYAVSRRVFLKGAAAMSFAHTVLAMAQMAVKSKKIFAYVGTYTGEPGSGSNGEGIYRFEMDAATGALTQRTLAAKTTDPSWITIHPSKRFLYAVNEVSDFHGSSGSVSAFAIERESGDLTALNVVSSEGAGPCYLSIDAAGKYAFVANYGGGTTAVFPIQADGRLGAASDVHRDSGHVGASTAKDAPAGSFAASGHDAPHAHMIAPDPKGQFVLATDLGQDRIYTYRFDQETGTMKLADGANFEAMPSGDGPRHFAFHPNGRWLYAIQEEASTVVVFDYAAETGTLSAKQTISALPKRFGGTSFAAEILVSPDGKFVYAGNRLHDTIAVFAVGADGLLKWTGETSTLGDYPGQCRIDPTGNFLYACNRKGDSITCFRIHRTTGALVFTGQYTAVGSPGSITFL